MAAFYRYTAAHYSVIQTPYNGFGALLEHYAHPGVKYKFFLLKLRFQEYVGGM